MGIRDLAVRVSGLPLRAVGRVALIVAVAAAIITATLHEFNHAASPGTADVPTARTRPSDPLAEELARCHAIGMAAKDDSACALAWAENRRRFFEVAPPSPPLAEAK